MCSEVPRERARRPSGRGAALLLGLVVAAGCGKQGPPLPPLRYVPATTQDLAVRQRGAQLLLAFAYPEKTTAGLALPGLAKVELWQLERPASEVVGEGGAPHPLDPRAFEPAARLALSLSGKDLTAATSGGEIVLALPLPEPLPEPPAARYLAVRTFSARGDRSALSNIVAAVLETPPPPPTAVSAAGGGDGITVSWQVERPPAEGFDIYRRGPQTASWGAPLGTAHADEGSYLDPTARFGERYSYAVTAVTRRAPLVESRPAESAEISYEDRFAPPPPRQLVTLPETDRVRLVWEGSAAPDLAGYRVYRARGDGGFEALTPEPIPALEYTDSSPPAHAVLRYRVTAVDRAGNESAPSDVAVAEIP